MNIEEIKITDDAQKVFGVAQDLINAEGVLKKVLSSTHRGSF